MVQHGWALNFELTLGHPGPYLSFLMAVRMSRTRNANLHQRLQLPLVIGQLKLLQRKGGALQTTTMNLRIKKRRRLMRGGKRGKRGRQKKRGTVCRTKSMRVRAQGRKARRK